MLEGFARSTLHSINYRCFGMRRDIVYRSVAYVFCLSFFFLLREDSATVT